MVQFPGFPSYDYGFIIRYHDITHGEFPHSDIHGYSLICSSPWLFAACHVLLRRHVPRHPPYALCSLFFSIASAIRRINFSRYLYVRKFLTLGSLCFHINLFLIFLGLFKSFYSFSLPSVLLLLHSSLPTRFRSLVYLLYFKLYISIYLAPMQLSIFIPQLPLRF